MKNRININKNNIEYIISESIKKILKENYDYNHNSKDIEELRHIYNMTLQLEQYIENSGFENSPLVEYTTKILNYCVEQKKRILGK